MNTSIENITTVSKALSELNVLMNENKDAIDDINNYKEELNSKIFTNKNEFEKLSETEISKKLDNILDEIILDEIINDSSNVNFSQNENSINLSKSNNNSNSETTEETKPNSGNVSDNELEDNFENVKDRLELLNNLTNSLNDKFLNLINILPTEMIPADILSVEQNIQNFDNESNKDSDESTINPDDLETESESESDLEEEVDNSKVKKNVGNINFDLFSKLAGGLEMNDFEKKLKNLGEMPDMSKMSQILENFDFSSFIGVFENLNKTNSQEPVDELNSFIIEETQNEKSQQTDSEEESSVETDDEESDDKEKDDINSDNNEGIFQNFISKLTNNKGGINFDFSNLSSMFGLFGSEKNNFKDFVEKLPKKNNANTDTDTDSDIDYDERNGHTDSESDNEEGAIEKDKKELVNDKMEKCCNNDLNECLDNNQKMINDMAQMMSKLGINLIDIKELSAQKNDIKIKKE